MAASFGIVDGFGLSSIFEEGGRDAEPIAESGDGYPFEQVPLECGDLIVGREMQTFAVHDEMFVQVRLTRTKRLSRFD